MKAMVSVSLDGEMQALICTEPSSSYDHLCLSCQHVCRMLNAALERCDFAQAARLAPDDFDADFETTQRLASALGILKEAMFEAIIDFENSAIVSEEFEYTEQPTEMICMYA